MQTSSVKEIITSYLGENLRNVFIKVDEMSFSKFQEIRVRVNNEIIIYSNNKENFIDANGKLSEKPNNAVKASNKDINQTIEIISNYSMYAFEEELKKGYITLSGGHRVGITGKAVTQNNSVKTIRNINGLNIRISHEIIGCADKVIDYIWDKSDLSEIAINHTMIISPPACGKTTLLRDIIRKLSGNCKSDGVSVGVVDERSEIAGCYLGVAQNDLGIRTDILDSCPKHEGMTMLLRSMAPKVIAVDEIGSNKDIEAIEDIVNAGVKVICTIHGRGVEDIMQKSEIKKLLSKNVFTRFIILEKRANIKYVLNENFTSIKSEL